MATKWRRLLEEYCHGQGHHYFSLVGKLRLTMEDTLKSVIKAFDDMGQFNIYTLMFSERGRRKYMSKPLQGTKNSSRWSVSHMWEECQLSCSGLQVYAVTLNIHTTQYPFFPTVMVGWAAMRSPDFFFSGRISHVPNRSAIYQCQTLPTSSVPDGTGCLEYRLMISTNFL